MYVICVNVQKFDIFRLYNWKKLDKDIVLKHFF